MNQYDDFSDMNKRPLKKPFNPFSTVSKKTYMALLTLWILILIIDGLEHYFVNY